MTEEPLISLRHMSRSFLTAGETVTVLQDISLQINAGEMVAIIGPSGSGKSTLMNILGCLDAASHGEVRIAGVDTGTATKDQLAALRSKNIGFIFQRYHLMSYLNAVDNVAVPARYTAMQHEQQTARAALLLSRLGLEDRVFYKPAQLSGGQQQRVSIARALMNGANIILADEPTGALDGNNGKALMDILHSLHQAGHTVIIVTHDRNIARQARRIIEIRDGRILADSVSSSAQHVSGTAALPLATDTGRASALQSMLDAVKMAWQALRGHRVRTLLSMLGVIIGVASVIASMAVGEGARKKIISDISALGTSSLSVRPGLGWGSSRPDLIHSLSLTDVELLGELGFIEHISPVFNKTLEGAVGKQQLFFSLSGVNADYFSVHGLRLHSGRGLSEYDIETRQPVLIIDSMAAKTLFPDEADPVGKTVHLAGVPFSIIGVTTPKGMLSGGGSITAWVPYTSLQERLAGRIPLTSVDVMISKGTSFSQAQNLIEAFLDGAHGRRDFFVHTDDIMLRAIQKASHSLTLLISAIAAISLIVGGIGVMNIMLISVTERTHEIGVRLAVGARAADIMRQFLVESVVICLLGCCIGITLTFIAGFIFSFITHEFTLVFTVLPVIFSCAFSILIGLCFGFIPARNAARLKPTEALACE